MKKGKEGMCYGRGLRNLRVYRANNNNQLYVKARGGVEKERRKT